MTVLALPLWGEALLIGLALFAAGVLAGAVALAVHYPRGKE